MIFISHLLRSLYFFISQSALHYMFGSFTSHLTKTYYWRYRATMTDIWIILYQYLLYRYKNLTDLHYKQQNFIINISICTKLHILYFIFHIAFFHQVAHLKLSLLCVCQVYYECLGLGDPLLLKSERAQRLYSHLRHPVCVELLTVLWLLPTFPLDRLLLASYLSVYLILAHSLDTQDCTYLRRQLRSKLQLFSAPLEDSDQSNSTYKTD